MRINNIVESLEKKYSIEKEEKRPLHESFVEEWWGQTDEDPFDFAYEYGLTCKKIGHNNDEDLYRFSGEKEDFDKARKDGYFYSLDFDADEGHSEDLNESKELKEDADDIVTVSVDSTLTKEDVPEYAEYLKNTFGIDIVKFDEFKRYDDLTVRGKKSAVIDFLVDHTDEDPEWVKETWHLNESKELNESTAGDIIWEKVRDVIREKIENEIIDNLAMVINSEVPEYNPDWCAESSNQSQWAADKLAEELATELMFELE